MSGNDRGIENILEAGKLGHGFEARRAHHLVRRPARNGPAILQHDHLLAQRKNLFPAVGDINDRDTMLLVPGAQIIDNLRFGGGIQRRQRFIQQKDGGIGHQGASQRDSLALPSGNLPRPARRADAQCGTIPELRHCGACVAHSATRKPVLDIALDRQMGK